MTPTQQRFSVLSKPQKTTFRLRIIFESYLDALIQKELVNPSCIPASMIADSLLEWFTISDSTQ
jgi:hypothetical protein